jgi:indole-3-glycerol phosphate synthase
MSSKVTILDQILQRKREEVIAALSVMPLETLRRYADVAPPARSFGAALQGPGISVIGEIKRASPSAGIFAPDLDSVATAQLYEASGASAISVLTDSDFFHGSVEDLELAREATSLPILRKDFIFDRYQVYQSRVMGADAILLIVAAVDDLVGLLGVAQDIGLSCLVEVHDEDEVEQALLAKADIIGINNRDLRTFDTTLKVTEDLCQQLPDDVIIVSESGIKEPADVERLGRAGIDAILVGESLVRSSSPAQYLRALREAGYE